MARARPRRPTSALLAIDADATVGHADDAVRLLHACLPAARASPRPPTRTPDRITPVVAAVLAADTAASLTAWLPGTIATRRAPRSPGSGSASTVASTRCASRSPGPTPIRVPDGVGLRTFRPGTDDAAWLRVNNRAFENHPDQGGWVEAVLARRMAEPWFDPAGFLLAWRGDELAGFCWTKVHEEPERLGEIFVIGVDPDAQGIGLGRALRARRPRPPGAASASARPASSTWRPRTHRPSALVRVARLHGAPHRHRARPGSVVSTRYGASARRTTPSGSRRTAHPGTGPTRSGRR